VDVHGNAAPPSGSLSGQLSGLAEAPQLPQPEGGGPGRRTLCRERQPLISAPDVHRAQLLSYLKLGEYRLGYLLNFNVKMLKGGICRLANGL